VRRFGVSMSLASGDIGRYLALASPGVSYDKSAKRYVATGNFKPALARPDAGRFLSELRLIDLGVLKIEDSMLGTAPPFDATPVPAHPIDAYVLRAVLKAIRERAALDVSYQSMSRPEPARRTIEPHAIAHDGFRWHARAFDRETGEFRDFVLGRLSKPRPGGAAVADPRQDDDWGARSISSSLPIPSSHPPRRGRSPPTTASKAKQRRSQ
jgi:hypothetical protein